MGTTALLLLAIAAIALLLVLVIWVKIPAFIALLAVSIATALAAGISPPDVIALVRPALLLASSIIDIPIFFDVAFIILIPIIFSKAAGLKSPMTLGLPRAFMLFIHVVEPPHPGIAGSAAVTDADMGMITMLGLLLCIPVGVLTHFLSEWINRREYSVLDE